MGAVTSILYTSIDPTISCQLLDSPFSSLRMLVEEIVKRQISIADFVIDMAIEIVSDSVRDRANFAIKDIEPINFIKKCFINALFCVAKGDDFVEPHHSKRLYDVYPGEKSFLDMEGDHNSIRPKDMKEKAIRFFYQGLNCDKLQEMSDKYAICNQNNGSLMQQPINFNIIKNTNTTSTTSNTSSSNKKTISSKSKQEDPEKIHKDDNVHVKVHGRKISVTNNINIADIINNESNTKKIDIKPIEPKQQKQPTQIKLAKKDKVYRREPIIITNVKSKSSNSLIKSINFNNSNSDNSTKISDNSTISTKTSNNSTNEVTANTNYYVDIYNNYSVFQINKSLINKIYGIEKEMNEEEVLKKISEYYVYSDCSKQHEDLLKF